LIDRALGLNSNFAEAWSFGGWVKLWLGEPEAAIERFARAIRLSPLDKLVAGMRAGTAHAYFFLGRYDEAKSWAAQALQYNPNHNPALRIGAASDAMAGRLEQAQKTIIRLQQVYPTLVFPISKTCWALAAELRTAHDTRKGCDEPGYPNECRGQGASAIPGKSRPSTNRSACRG
jgi:tetratricopeptide (TPR) repeat protein